MKRTIRKLPVVIVIVLSLALVRAASADDQPVIINFQGRITAGNTNFDGTGQFKFVIVVKGPTTPFGDYSAWSNDGNSIAGGAPTLAVPITVTKGLFSVGGSALGQ